MSIDELMTLLERHPSEIPVLAISEPPASTVFAPVAVQAPPAPNPAAVLLILRPLAGRQPTAQRDEGRS